MCRSQAGALEELADALQGEGSDAAVLALSDRNAEWFVSELGAGFERPLFKDSSTTRAAWCQMAEGARKHDTFVYDRAGARVLYWRFDAGKTLTDWRAEVGAAVRAAHTLKGTCRQLGALALGNLFGEIESAAKVGDFVRAQRKFDDGAELIARSLEALKRA